MVYSGIMHRDDWDIRNSHNQMYEDWEDLYGLDKSVFLPDTYGSEFAFRTLPEEKIRSWDGFRWDSGNVYDFGEKVISLYDRLGVRSAEKVLVPSDGLTLPVMVRIERNFRNRIHCQFGWGTNLTNDVGLSPLSLVIKVVKSNGYGTVKLSDNLAKALGEPKDVERFKRIFGYTSTFSEACKY
jgi:nicotinate phosphoribosyltransferase